MAPPNRNRQPAKRRHPRRQTADRREYKRARQAADARWRAEMSKCFDALRCLVPSLGSRRSDRRGVCKGDILDAAAGHVHYLEGVVSKLLEKKRGRNKRELRDLEDVRDGFLSCDAAYSALSRASQRDSKFSVKEELVPSSERSEERDPAKFTALRETPAPCRADMFSASSSPTSSEVWLNNGIADAACMSSPTMKALMDSFCENVPDPAQGLCNVEVAPNAEVGAGAALPPNSDQRGLPILSGPRHFTEGSKVYAELNRAEGPLLCSAVVPNTSPGDQNQSPTSAREPWILDSRDWILGDLF